MPPDVVVTPPGDLRPPAYSVAAPLFPLIS
jgi:hypothetical protein